jgi:hypothetical protein
LSLGRGGEKGIGTRVALSEAGTLVYRAGSSTSRLMLVDASGRSEPLGTELGDFVLPRFSPDGRRIAVGRGDRWGYSHEVARDVWLVDRDSGQVTRLTRTGTARRRGGRPTAAVSSTWKSLGSNGTKSGPCRSAAAPRRPPGWGVRKQDAQLRQALNEYLANVRRTATWNRLVVKHFGAAAIEILKKARGES